MEQQGSVIVIRTKKQAYHWIFHFLNFVMIYFVMSQVMETAQWQEETMEVKQEDPMEMTMETATMEVYQAPATIPEIILLMLWRYTPDGAVTPAGQEEYLTSQVDPCHRNRMFHFLTTLWRNTLITALMHRAELSSDYKCSTAENCSMRRIWVGFKRCEDVLLDLRYCCGTDVILEVPSPYRCYFRRTTTVQVIHL